MAAGGFDIIVGNPPYVTKTDYPTEFLKTHKAGDTYAYFVEVSLNLLRPGGRIGYIIPVAGISTKKKTLMQSLLLESCSVLKVSNYDDRPGKLFVGLEHCRSSIILGTKHNTEQPEHSCAVFTTDYKRWKSGQRHTLFKNIRYVPLNFSGILPCTKNGIPLTVSKMGTIPKIGDELEIGILAKIYQKPLLEHFVDNGSDLLVYYHDAPQYWIHATRCKKSSVGVKDSTHVKSVELKSKKSLTVVLALLNSSLFYWFFIKMSNCRDLNKNIVLDMPVGVDEFASGIVAKLAKLTDALMKNYVEHSKIKTNADGALRGEIYPEYGKDIIDKIDDILAKHYGFTGVELDYIKNFQLEFRMGINDL